MLQNGDTGTKVKALQKLLDKYGSHLVIDGVFGPATEHAVREFQKDYDLEIDGIVGEKTLPILITAVKNLPKAKTSAYPSLAERLLKIALTELAAGAKEIGGPNSGPFVKKYTGGFEGEKYPWCAYFALNYCLRLAAAPNKPPIKEKSSSSRLKKEADKLKLYTEDIKDIYPGCLFVVKGGPTGFKHTGIVRAVVSDTVIWTVEGNASDRVSSWYRNIKNLGFILIKD
jgi:hypothetical protein